MYETCPVKYTNRKSARNLESLVIKLSRATMVLTLFRQNRLMLDREVRADDFL